MCNCKELPTLVEISNSYVDFKLNLNSLEVGDWVHLMECQDCSQLWKLDEWDKYQNCYAVKLPTKEGWQQFDSESLIKEKMLENRGGVTNQNCIWANCNLNQVKGSAYCINHLWQTGARA